MSEKNRSELEKAAQKPGEDALKLHPFYKGKIETMLKCSIRSFDDFAIWYSPGVAAPCKDISNNKEKVFEHSLTNIKNVNTLKKAIKRRYKKSLAHLSDTQKLSLGFAITELKIIKRF